VLRFSGTKRFSASRSCAHKGKSTRLIPIVIPLVTAIKYINQWLEQNEYPQFDKLTLEDVEGDNLYVMVLNIGLWFARGNFPTRQNTFLANSSKDTIFKNMKECFKEKFGREHDLFKDDRADTWFAEIKGRLQ